MERRNIAVPRAHGGEAVARILHDGLGVPHSTAKGLIDAGCVTINGRPARSHGQRCEGGDVVEVRFDPERRYEPRPQPRHGPGFRVIHEDLEIVVADKMPGLLSSPAPGRRDESLAELIAESLRSRGIKKPQLFVVHRLDQHTSGLLVFARSSRAMEWMAAQFESREAGRVYTAVVSGQVERERGTIQSWLVEDPKSLSVHTTSTRGAGKRAITHFAVQERFDEATLVRVGLETGRKHQIRIHFAEIGHALLGDRRYGEPSPLLSRVALHAERLTFRHPRTLERITFEAPLPDDLSKLVGRLRRGSGAREHLDEVVEPRSASTGRTRVAVFPQGLMLTDPLGPTASHLLDPIAAKTEGRAAAAGPRTGTVEQRDRLLRQRAVGHRPPQRRAPVAGAPPARGVAPWKSETANAPHRAVAPDRAAAPAETRKGGGKPGGAPQWSGKTGGAPRSSGEPESAKRWAGKPEGAKRWASKPDGAKSWARKPEGAKNWASKPEGAGSWSGKPRSAKPWSGKPQEGKPWGEKSRDAQPPKGRPREQKPWSGKPRDEPWSGKPREAKPWSGKPRDAKPWSGKPRDAKPWSGKPRDAKPWSGKPRDAKPWSGKPRDAKPWSGKPPASGPQGAKGAGARPVAAASSAASRHASGSAAPRKPWEFKEKGSTLRRERLRKGVSGKSKGHGKGKKP
jgi:23S rRNA pseudouridine1911/1915/1917 synthase